MAVDLVVRGGLLVTPDGPVAADLAVEDGKVFAVGPDLEEITVEEIAARGLHVLPGAVDAHVHFNEPGRTHWEGFETGTRALTTGGVTSYVEMPLNAYPPTCDVASFDEKLARATKSSLVDFAFWGGLVPGNLEHMEGLADRGVLGFKAFMSTTGTLDFQAADNLTLFEGMRKAAELGLPVLALVDLNARFTLQAEDLHYRHKMSPYVGKNFRGRVVRTVPRGTTIFRDGRIASRPIGKLIKPSHRREERWWKGA